MTEADPYLEDISASMQHECGLFACVCINRKVVTDGKIDVTGILSLGLIGLQHRGQESAGIVLSEGDNSMLRHHRGMGEVSHILKRFFLENQNTKCPLAIGHTRYSTMGASEGSNSQPLIVESTYGQFAMAHNGELVNSKELKRDILRRGVGLSTGTDSEVITQLLCATPNCGEPNEINWLSRIQDMMSHTPTSYSLLILHRDRVFALRDPYGNRPLCIGKVVSRNGEDLAYVISSESAVFQSLGAQMVREVLAGEIVEFRVQPNDVDPSLPDNGVIRSLAIVPRPPNTPTAMCLFEYVYFARPDSYFEGQQVYGVRFRSGVHLAQEAPVEADLVSVIPDSATPAALGFSHGSGIPFVEVLSRNRFVGRTFIQPSEHLRQLGVSKKFGVLNENFVGKRVVLVDDSIVRGNTIRPILALLRNNGATEVHVRIASPPVKYPCYMGINIPTREELIANSKDADELAKHVGADSLRYLSIEGLLAATEEKIPNRNANNSGHCDACFTGHYPVPLSF